jgi:hypothetical protein
MMVFIHNIKIEESSQTLKFLRLNDEKFKKKGRNKKDVDSDLAIEKFKVLYILGSSQIYELQKQIDADFVSKLASLTKISLIKLLSFICDNFLLILVLIS